MVIFFIVKTIAYEKNCFNRNIDVSLFCSCDSVRSMFKRCQKRCAGELSESYADCRLCELFAYGEVLSKVILKDKATIKLASNLFSAPQSFEIHEMVKNCAHMPDAVIIFHSKKGEVKVSYSFYCDVCRFAQGNEYNDFDGDKVRLKFL